MIEIQKGLLYVCCWFGMKTSCLLRGKMYIIKLITISISAISCLSLTAGLDSEQIFSLLQKIYTQRADVFLKINTKESLEKREHYYEQFFTPDSAKKMIKFHTMTPEKSSLLYDPRTGRAFTPDPEPDGYKYVDFSYHYKYIYYNMPKIKNNYAVVYVDTVLENSDIENRSVYSLYKTNNTWKIENITWGPKQTMEEGSTQMIFTLFQ